MLEVRNSNLHEGESFREGICEGTDPGDVAAAKPKQVSPGTWPD